jgi:glycosyltransferase involved in cell wall biosynthesis
MASWQPRVVWYTDDSRWGGVARYNHAVLCALAGRGYPVTCVQAAADTPLVRRQTQAGVRHAWLDYDPAFDVPRMLQDSADARRRLRELRPDLVVFSNGMPVSHLAARQVALVMGLPFVVVEGLAAPYLAQMFPQAIPVLAQQYVQAREVIAVSADNLRCLRQHFGLPAGKGRVIHYGRPEEFFRPPNADTRRRLRGECGIPEEAVLCFTAGRLHPLKGYLHQLAAVEILRHRPVWTRLYFAWAGEGQLDGALRERLVQMGVADHVKLLGQRGDVADWLDAADVFVLPSHAEGMPLAVMEGLRRAVGDACRARASELFREGRMVKETLEVLEAAMLPPGDYVSPGLSVVRPDRCFPHLRVGDPRGHPWPYIRRQVPHNWYVDARFPSSGWLNRDEAHLLYYNARPFKGRRGLEIGCFLGWSTCHLALAGLDLDVLDPLLDRPDFAQSVAGSLRALGPMAPVRLVAGLSPQKVEELAAREGRRWSFFLIDGDHDGAAPLEDARVCARFATPDAMVMFHDLACPDVARGLAWFRDQGWQVCVYQTMQLVGVAWRGGVRPVPHQPDPTVRWELPEHLRDFQLA